MSEFPSSSLVAQVSEIILRTFDVTPQQAREYGSGLAALAEDWGSPEKAAKLDWAYRVKKDLGEKLRWRSNDECEQFGAEQEKWFRNYDALIQKSKRPPLV